VPDVEIFASHTIGRPCRYEVEVTSVGCKPRIRFDAVPGKYRRHGIGPSSRRALTHKYPPALELRRTAHKVEITVPWVERGVGLELWARDSARCPWCNRRGPRVCTRANVRKAEQQPHSRELHGYILLGPVPPASGLHNFTREVPKRGARTLRATFGLCPALAHRPWGPVPGVPLKKVVNLVDEFAWTAARPHAPGATLLAPSRPVQFSANSGVLRLTQAWPRPNTPSAHERRRSYQRVAVVLPGEQVPVIHHD